MDLVDPLKMCRVLWPHVKFYKKQQEIIYSVMDNTETFVPAGNMLGKDFVSAFIILWFFLSRTPVRVVTTSADHNQLEAVLWGEVRRFITADKGGPLVCNHLHLRKLVPMGSLDPKTGKQALQVCGLSYAIGRVAAKGEGMLGHHIAEDGTGIPRTLFVADEASGVDDVSYERASTWAKRLLVIGNPYPCANFFFKGVKGGDITEEQLKSRQQESLK
jgi:hypothetical protein